MWRGGGRAGEGGGEGQGGEGRDERGGRNREKRGGEGGREECSQLRPSHPQLAREHSHHMRLRPVLSTRMPRNGEAPAEMRYTRLFKMLAWLELTEYLSIRNTLQGMMNGKG